MSERERFKVERATVDKYGAYLKDKYRPPSKGGNTRAWHQHVLTVGGEMYSFLAADSRKWVHKGETVSFEWQWDDTGKYRNVDRDSVIAWNKDGDQVIRGNRAGKEWRTADPRPPGRRSEWND